MARTKAAKFAYEFGSEERREWVIWLPCVVCECSPCDNHHTRTDGTSRKGPYQVIVPLCEPWMSACHARYHQGGRDTLLAEAVRERGGLIVGGDKYQTWEEAAAAVERLWLEYSEGLSH